MTLSKPMIVFWFNSAAQRGSNGRYPSGQIFANESASPLTVRFVIAIRVKKRFRRGCSPMSSLA